MILEYVGLVGEDERVLDTLTVDDETGAVIASATDRGRATVEMLQRRYGDQAARALPTWSNGYVLLREVTEQAARSDGAS